MRLIAPSGPFPSFARRRNLFYASSSIPIHDQVERKLRHFNTTTTKNKSEKAKIKSAELPSNRYHTKKFAPVRVLSRARMLFFYAEWQLKCTLSETRARVLAIHGRVFERKIRLPLVNFLLFFFLVSQNSQVERDETERETPLSTKQKSALSFSLSLCTHSRSGWKSNQNRYRTNEYRHSSCIRNRFESFARIRRRS